MQNDTTKNVQLSVQDNILTITIDLTKDYGLSTAGRSNIVANCHWLPIPENENLSLVLTLVKRQPRRRRQEEQ